MNPSKLMECSGMDKYVMWLQREPSLGLLRDRALRQTALDLCISRNVPSWR